MTGGVAKDDDHWPPGETETSAGVKVSSPLFQGGAKVWQLYQAQSVHRELKQVECSTKDGIVLVLEQKWAGLQDVIENVYVRKDYIAAADERAKIAQQQYSVGLISFDNWTIIEDDLVRNKKAFLTAQADALLAEAHWILSKGETLEYEN